MKVLLVGNPNVGKSVIFSRLTGLNVISSNYPGTSIDYTKGYFNIQGERAELIDVPGIYSLEPTCKTEEIAVKLIKNGDVFINIIDSTNLERGLNLALQLIQYKKPLLIVLNLFDETRRLGVSIDIKKIEQILGVPCVATCALTGEGIKELKSKIGDATISEYVFDYSQRWNEIGKIINEVQEIKYHSPKITEKLRDATIRPITGIPILILVLLLTFALIRFIGEGLIGAVFEPFFEKAWSPLILRLSELLGQSGFFHDLLIGKLVGGDIDYGESFGLLTTGLFIPLGAVLPYVFAFYTVLAVLEDSGYLPRVAVMVDNITRKAGMNGTAIIPMLLGFGCNVPGALATRLLKSRKEKFIAATLMSITVPCMALQAMLFGLLGPYGIKGLGIVFGTLIIVWFILGLFLNKIIKGPSREIFVDIPPYRIPYLRGLAKKIWMRLRWFIKEAVPFMLLGVLIANLLYSLGIMQFFSGITAPVFNHLLDLPPDAVGAMIMGFLRKDLAVGMLIPLNMSLKQLIVASVVLSMYFPCVATFAVLLKELGLVDMLKSTLIMILVALITGSVLNAALTLTGL
ncbi:MAG: ferrous iron transporter B [Bacteroidales bacterium]|nr:ferrous iron transporter B [Bacteroidales bacterium]